MDAGTLQALELIGWVLLLYWLLTVPKSARKTTEEARERGDKASKKATSHDS